MAIYDVNGNQIPKYPTIIGDGIADDTVALQAIINNNKSVHLPTGLKIRLTSSISIDIANCDTFDGGNSLFIVDGNFTAFAVSGSLTLDMVARPDTLNDEIIQKEAVFRFVNCRITSVSKKSGTGVSLSGCFKTVIEGCYIYYLSVGIALKNQIRDLIIANNQIYACWDSGIHIESTVNIHQFNIVDNVMTYSRKEIFIDNPVMIANWQCVGNDIEIGLYPDVQDRSDFRAIHIVSGNSQLGQLSEIEICGNTIQGHSASPYIIEINGGTNRYVQHLSIVGNHISNATSNAIKLSKVKTASVGGNTYKDVTGYVVNLDNCDRITIVGESANNVGGMVSQTSCTNIVSANNNA